MLSSNSVKQKFLQKMERTRLLNQLPFVRRTRTKERPLLDCTSSIFLKKGSSLKQSLRTKTNGILYERASLTVPYPIFPEMRKAGSLLLYFIKTHELCTKFIPLTKHAVRCSYHIRGVCIFCQFQKIWRKVQTFRGTTNLKPEPNSPDS